MSTAIIIIIINFNKYSFIFISDLLLISSLVCLCAENHLDVHLAIITLADLVPGRDDYDDHDDHEDDYEKEDDHDEHFQG